MDREQNSIAQSLLALIGIISVCVSIPLFSAAIRFFNPKDSLQDSLQGECVYQVAIDGAMIGTRSFADPISLKELLKSFDSSFFPNEPVSQVLPCDSLVNLEGSGASLSISRISGTQLIALGKKISINSSSKEDLEAAPGIGPGMAERIVTFRSAIGAFQSLSELEHVSGIGPKKSRELKQFLKL